MRLLIYELACDTIYLPYLSAYLSGCQTVSTCLSTWFGSLARYAFAHLCIYTYVIALDEHAKKNRGAR
jgi:hypothetical protein